MHEAFYTLVLSGDENEGGVKLTALEDNTEAVVVCASDPPTCYN